MWLKAVYATAFIAFEVALVKMSLAASIHDCWNPEKLNRMKFPVSQRETFFAFFLLFILLYTCIITNYLITIYYYHQHSSLVEIGTIKIIFLDSVVWTGLRLFFMYSQCSFGWSFKMIKTPKFNLTWIAFPQTMFQIEAGATYSSLSPAHGVLFQNRSLLKKVTEHTAHFSPSLKILVRGHSITT